LALTESGLTPRLLSKYKPHVAILCITPHTKTARQALINRGVIPLLVEKFNVPDNEHAINFAIEWAKERALVKVGEIVIVVAGVVEGVPGSTNMMKVEIIK